MYFKINVTEKEDGCQDAETKYLVEADSPEKATERTNNFVSDMYEDEGGGRGHYRTFFEGDIVFTISNPIEIGLKQFTELNKDRYAIG